ncbi:glycosyltransferase family 8 protein [Nemania sp. FL0916]|nr:glycosyltransferase family 8 protein [Nemania sp. FL0916]
MALQGGGAEREDVYATLLLTDTYLPGALVLAHSLRDAGTTKKLAALVTLDSVSAEAVTELKAVYDYVIPVPRIRNAHPANLELMNRTDLHSAFTKICLWSQTQFRKIVYLDADIVAYRAPDELFDITHPFSAAPDIGWPDLFNTGVMVLTPNLGDYYAMMAMAERGISFDGADQGLINTHFRNNYNRISFAYNVTPSAHYQYIPAYRHFQSSINMVHFIGSDKPWFKGRHASTGSSPFDEMTGRWWAVYDRHYRATAPQPPQPEFSHSGASHPGSSQPLQLSQTPSVTTVSKPVSELVQYHTRGEYQPRSTHVEPFSKPYSDAPHDYSHVHGHGHGHDHHSATQHHIQHHQPDHHHQSGHQTIQHHDSSTPVVHGEHQQHQDPHVHQPPLSETVIHQPEPSRFVSSDVISSLSNTETTQAKPGEEQVHAQNLPSHSTEPERAPPPFQAPMSDWDAQRHPPPAESKPEAVNFPATTYEMSNSTAPFIAPRQYPSPPKDMWYEVPKEAPAAPSEPPKPIFPWEAHRSKPSRVFADEEPSFIQGAEPHDPAAPPGEQWSTPVAQPSAESSMTETSTVEQRSQPATPTTPTIQISLADPWTSYSRTNAWDEVPEIERYVDSMQKHKRSKSLKAPGSIALPSPSDRIDSPWERRGSKLTDFPSEVERPSLPVTPAPIHRRNFWGGGPNTSQGHDDPLLPSAAGVPGQSDWDPEAQLEQLAQQHSEELLRKLSGDGRDSSDMPPRLLPFGSEKLISPTYVAQSAHVLSPQPIKGNASSSSILNMVTESEMTPRTAPLVSEQAVLDAPLSSEGSTSESETSSTHQSKSET